MSQTTIEIRPSIAEDFAQLMAIDNVAWNDDSAPAEIHWESLEAYAERCPAGSQTVAVIDGVVCGYLSFRNSIPIPSHAHVAELIIAIHPDYQGKGIGRRLIEAAEDWCRQNGKRKLCLRVLSTNPAVAFYKKCGFLEQGRLVDEFCINGRYVDDVMMYKLIETDAR